MAQVALFTLICTNPRAHPIHCHHNDDVVTTREKQQIVDNWQKWCGCAHICVILREHVDVLRKLANENKELSESCALLIGKIEVGLDDRAGEVDVCVFQKYAPPPVPEPRAIQSSRSEPHRGTLHSLQAADISNIKQSRSAGTAKPAPPTSRSPEKITTESEVSPISNRLEMTI
jgi:hypothetical protein